MGKHIIIIVFPCPIAYLGSFDFDPFTSEAINRFSLVRFLPFTLNIFFVFLFADGFEEVEGLTPVDLLRRARIDIKMVSITEDLWL